MEKQKHLARELVKASWNAQEYKIALKGERIVYDSQRNKANDVYGAFLEGVSLVNLIAPPQWGKTGTMLYTAYLMTTHPDDAIMTLPENVFIITGMSDKEWERQTKGRMLPIFGDNVYHRARFQQGIAERLAGARDSFIIIDECHFGSEKDQTLHTRLKDAGFLDIDHLRQHNVKILCISATPGSLLIDAQTWGSEHQRTIVCPLDEPGYVGFKTMIAETRLRNFANKKGEFGKILDIISTRWCEPRWHMVRVMPSNEDGIIKAIQKAGFSFMLHNSSTPLGNVDALLSKTPKLHTFIIIKGFYKAAKTFKDKHMGVCLDASKDCNMAAQGLAGRMCGHGKQTGALAPLIFCNLAKLKEYITWYENDCDYFQSKSYTSANITIRNGNVTKKKDTVVHASEVENLEPVLLADLPARNKHSHEAPSVIPRKVGIVPDAGDVRIVSQVDTYADAESFAARFGLTLVPDAAKPLKKALENAGIRANVSFKTSSMKDVSNLVNYYTKKAWAGNEYHIIKNDGNSGGYTVIRRDVGALNSAKLGDRVIAHNHLEQLVLYEYVATM
jgi:hypothetical protein